MRIIISENSMETVHQLQEELDAYQKKLSLQMFRALTLIESQVKQNLRHNSGLHVRTGALLNSIGASKKVFEKSDGLIYGELGPEGIPYAKIHEFGGTIVPKEKKFLAIPTEENMRPDGSPKITTQDLMNGLIPSFINKGVIFGIISGGKGGKVAQAMALFRLRSSVTIPARPYLAPALAATKDTILKNFGLFISLSFPPKKD